MKIWISIILFFFLTFLATPTILVIVDKEADTSCFYNLAEEEENNANFNEIKFFQVNSDFISEYYLEYTLQKTFRNFDEHLHSAYCVSIVIPPPELL